MKYFPFFIELNNKSILLVGGGEVAERKLDLLLKSNAKVTIVAPELTDYLEGFLKDKNVRFLSDETPQKS